MTPAPPMPQDIAAEKAVLCAMLNDATAAQVALAEGSPDMFFAERHGVIFGAMQRLSRTSSAIDVLTLRNELEAKHELDQIGGAEYLASLIDEVPTYTHVADHLRLVADKHRRRRLLANAGLLVEAAHNGKNLHEVATLLQSTAATMAGQTGTSPILIRAADVQAVNVRWLWPGRIPFGKLTCLDGDPGLGKSTLLLDVMTRYTNGQAFPDGSFASGKSGHVLVCTAEDEYGDTVKPRLAAAGADMDRVTFFDAISMDGQKHPIMFPEHVEVLEQAVEQTGATVVSIDPLYAFIGSKTNTWNDSAMRIALAPLQDMAERRGVALAVIRHWTKGTKAAIYRGGGTIGVSGASRSVLVVGEDPDYEPDPNKKGDHRRVLAVVKANLAAKAPSLAYRLVEDTIKGATEPVKTSRVEWLGTSELGADTLAMATLDNDDDVSALEEAREWLVDSIQHGTTTAEALMKGAAQAGHSWATVRRAKTKEKITSKHEGFGDTGRWVWRLPERGPACRA